ncbi:putative magnesium and cobalt transport protein [Rosellinia necatrix]|uniref:Putative magnesium and cobalt transport protein n=1 Tax=Rosellinia necatrix TaxID=77044 RepID=A0A1W2TL88_ROSNE|nr:putative magnesium and cobalt transport protein [Rosellinia necatrix]
MASDPNLVSDWWFTLDTTSELEIEFKQSVDDQTTQQQIEGRALIIRFMDGGGEVAKTYHPETNKENKEIRGDLTEFKEALSSAAKSDESCLVILENLGKQWIESLGCALKIPGYFFALHWARPVDHILGQVSIPLGQSPERHFILNYRQSLPFRINQRNIDKTYQLDCHAIRTVTMRRGPQYAGLYKAETSDQLLSYWGIKKTNKTSITVLLVDPCPGTYFYQASDWSEGNPLTNNGTPVASQTKFGQIRGQDWVSDSQELTNSFPPLSSLSVKDDATSMDEIRQRNKVQKPTMSKSPKVQSMFDQLSGFKNYPQEAKTPLQATYYARRVILARISAFVMVALQDVILLTSRAATGVKSIRDFSLEEIGINGWAGKWKGEFFTDLWELREELEEMGYKLERNLRTVKRISKIESSVRGEDDSSRQNACDLAEWLNLEATEKYMFKILERTSKAYVDAVQATSAQVANDQALSARRLTGFATIFVPASLSAAILAIPSFMGANDTTKFWYLKQ